MKKQQQNTKQRQAFFIFTFLKLHSLINYIYVYVYFFLIQLYLPPIFVIYNA